MSSCIAGGYRFHASFGSIDYRSLLCEILPKMYLVQNTFSLHLLFHFGIENLIFFALETTRQKHEKFEYYFAYDSLLVYRDLFHYLVIEHFIIHSGFSSITNTNYEFRLIKSNHQMILNYPP